MWKLKPGWLATQSNGSIELFSDLRAFRIDIPKRHIRKFFNGGVFSIPKNLNIPFVEELAQKLCDLNILTEEEFDKNDWATSLQSQYYYHLGLNPLKVLSKLKKSTVLILGLGGTGSIVLQHLIANEVGRLILVDDDIVEFSNLERQFIYDKKSIGNPKTEEAVRYIASRGKSTQTTILNVRITDEKTFASLIANLGEISACIVCIDYPPLKIFDIVSNVLWKNGIPFVHGGVMTSSGFWGPFFSSTFGSCNPQDFSFTQDISYSNNFTGPVKLCFSPFNSIIGSHLAADALHFLIGASHLIDFKHRTFIDLKNFSYIKC